MGVRLIAYLFAYLIITKPMKMLRRMARAEVVLKRPPRAFVDDCWEKQTMKRAAFVDANLKLTSLMALCASDQIMATNGERLSFATKYFDLVAAVIWPFRHFVWLQMKIDCMYVRNHNPNGNHPTAIRKLCKNTSHKQI